MFKYVYILSFFYLICLLPLSCAPQKKQITYIPRLDELVYSIRSRQERIKGVKGLARITIVENGRKQGWPASVQVNDKNFLRLAFLNLFYQPKYYFVINARHIYFFNTNFSEVKIGEPDKKNFFVLTGVALSPSDTVNFIMGKLPSEILEGNYRFIEGERNLLEISEKDGKIWQVRYNPTDLTLISLSQVDSSKKETFNVTWESWEEIEGVLFPLTIDILKQGENSGITVHYKDIVINPSIDDKLFFPTFPSEAVVENIY